MLFGTEKKAREAFDERLKTVELRAKQAHGATLWAKHGAHIDEPAYATLSELFDSLSETDLMCTSLRLHWLRALGVRPVSYPHLKEWAS